MQSEAEPYSALVRQLFDNTLHAGSLEDGVAIALEEQDVRIALSLRVDPRPAGPVIAVLRFKAWGCPHLIAAAEAFCDGYEGRPVADLGYFTGHELMQSLAVPVAKTGRILVLVDAVRSLGAAISTAKTDTSRT
jgi:NifU-like protein involved in Fe-S cluster formation